MGYHRFVLQHVHVSVGCSCKAGFQVKKPRGDYSGSRAVLEYDYVRKEKLETKHVDTLSKAYTLSEKLITKLVESKNRRETAQYDATPAISREMAKTALSDADEFITRIEEVLGG